MSDGRGEGAIETLNGDWEQLLATLTGVNATRITYYSELKKKIRELEVSNEQIREAKRVADELYQKVRQNADELAHLYEKSLRQAERLDRAIASLRSLSHVLTTTTLGVDALLLTVVRSVAQLFDTRCVVVSLDWGVGFQRVICSGLGQPIEPSPEVLPSKLRKLISAVERERHPIVEVLDGEERSTTVCVPMLREELLVGSICLQDHKSHNGRDFEESDLAILQTLSNQVAIAIENARLFEEGQHLQEETRRHYEMALQQKEEAERRTQELREARNELVLMHKEHIVKDERARIARELHDSVAQILTGIGLNLEWCRQHVPEDSPVHEHLLCAKQMARNGIFELRHAIFELSPVHISELGLVPALHKKIEESRRITGIDAQLTTLGKVSRLPVGIETALYRIAQEALYNAFKHAQATNVNLKVSFLSEELRMEVIDNGVGIAETSLRSIDEGQTFGLRSMLGRVTELGGRLEIKNLGVDGRGTIVRVTIPVRGD